MPMTNAHKTEHKTAQEDSAAIAGAGTTSPPVAARGEAGFLDPESMVPFLRLRRGDHAADFGAGRGYFTIPLARAVGGDGKVYAIDIQKPMLEIIRAKTQLQHLLNVECIWGDLDQFHGSKLKDGMLDFVIVPNVFFQIEHKRIILQEAYRILRKDGGRLAVIDWYPVARKQTQQQSPLLGPPPELRVGKEQVIQLAREAGFVPEEAAEFPAGAYHYGLLFRKTG